METLIPDILHIILKMLSDHGKISLLSITKKYDSFKEYVIYHSKVEFKKIMGLRYFDNFTNINISWRSYNICINFFPKNITHLIFDDDCFGGHHIQKCIPPTVTHLILDRGFDKYNISIPLNVRHLSIHLVNARKVKGHIPLGVTHLTFASIYDTMKECVPSSVTHLTIDNFDTSYYIKDYIPSNVMHLTFNNYDKSIIGCSSNVTHLTFNSLNASIQNCIPATVTHLTIDSVRMRYIKNYIPPTVRHLTFNRIHYNIKKSIPFGVTHLTICYTPDYLYLQDCVPSSVTHLTINHLDLYNDCHFIFNNISSSIECLTFV